LFVPLSALRSQFAGRYPPLVLRSSALSFSPLSTQHSLSSPSFASRSPLESQNHKQHTQNQIQQQKKKQQNKKKTNRVRTPFSLFFPSQATTTTT
jgi:hypothetical protein